MDFSEGRAGPGPVSTVPQMRIRQKVDELMTAEDYPAVERLLLYWLREAEAGGDGGGQLMILGELVGHYRKTGEREKAGRAADQALRAVSRLGLEDTVSAATAYVNIATAFNSFGEDGEALALFEKARGIYERRGPDPALLGGLYNNMGLCCAALGRFEEALSLYDRADEAIGRAPGGEPERAVTALNRADALEARLGPEAEGAIDRLLGEASALLRKTERRDGYFAYVCSRCAPVFDHYGWFADAEELRNEAKRIREGT